MRAIWGMLLGALASCVPLQDLDIYSEGLGSGGTGSVDGLGGDAATGSASSGSQGGQSGAICGDGIKDPGESCDHGGLTEDCTDACIPISCPEGCSCQMVGGSLFALCAPALAWTEARQFCENAGFGFDMPNSPAEEAMIQAWGAQLGAMRIWLGGTDIEEPGIWLTGDGDQFWQGGAFGKSVNGAYTNWSSDQPDNFHDQEHCAQISPTGSGSWNDLVCILEHPFVCSLRPSRPTPCGDGIVQPPEACDTKTVDEACDIDCTAPSCGDGLVNPKAGEECDDGNNDDLDACDNDCQMTGLVAHFPMKETLGSKVWDLARMEHHGTLSGSAVFEADGSGVTLSLPDDQVTVPIARAPSIVGEITMMLVFESSAAPTADGLMHHLITHQGAGQGETFLRFNDGSFQAGSWWTTASNEVTYMALPLSPGPHHLAGRHSGSRWSLFLDGTLVASNGAPNGALDLSGAWSLGGYLDRAFLGTIREVRLYDRQLSDEQIMTLAEASSPGLRPTEW